MSKKKRLILGLILLAFLIFVAGISASTTFTLMESVREYYILPQSFSYVCLDDMESGRTCWAWAGRISEQGARREEKEDGWEK